MAHVLVIGASKGIGLETVKAALAAGHRVRAFARSAAGIALAGAGLERFSGDALNAGDVASALVGVDVVVQALGVPVKDLLGPVTLFSDATNVLVPAMETAGVRRVITVTGFGTGDSREAIGFLQRVPFRLVFGRAYDDKDAQEMRIRRSALDWTFVRPGVLTPGSATGRYKVLSDPSSWRNGLISRADVAHFIVGQIDRPSYERKAVVLVG
ncbi:epimerase [Methylobacterium sp. Leaf399]|uniref:NAD(P)-dependent oxidoreductase n=1 Tax=unclassified Methylobacterium TaxID=2615210 RepID=UPI0006F66DBF|nr:MULTISPECIES: NAD(P)H-binding protein [unclassified Methylobacterium]KQP55257.1 epimerase [Methylobacterium sp. Leaf108]KQT09998.1 epimerase [Methylobacterium sp. Leaf399]KQT87612.1 epimerase [Methylobacterium sp. Leaf466]